MDAADRALEMQMFDRDTDMLAVCQLDLLAQLTRQLRAVHQTMRHIDKLRSTAHYVEPQLPEDPVNGTVSRLEESIEALDSQLQVEHSCCSHMRDTIIKMQTRIADLRRRTSAIDPPPAEPSQPRAQP